MKGLLSGLALLCVAGLPLLFSSITAQPETVVMKIPGAAMRIDVNTLLMEFNKQGCFQLVMRRYGLAQVASITQVAACNTLTAWRSA